MKDQETKTRATREVVLRDALSLLKKGDLVAAPQEFIRLGTQGIVVGNRTFRQAASAVDGPCEVCAVGALLFARFQDTRIRDVTGDASYAYQGYLPGMGSTAKLQDLFSTLELKVLEAAFEGRYGEPAYLTISGDDLALPNPLLLAAFDWHERAAEEGPDPDDLLQQILMNALAHEGAFDPSDDTRRDLSDFLPEETEEC